MFNAIRLCTSLQEMQQLVDTQLQQMQPRGVSIAMNHLAQLRPSPAAAAPLLDQLYTHLQQQWGLNRYGPGDLAVVLWSCSKLEYKSSNLYKDVLQAFIAKADSASPREVSNVIYVFAEQGHMLSNGNLQLLMDRLVVGLRQANAQDISNALYAVAKMERSVPAQQVQQMVGALCNCLEADPSKVAVQALSNTIWAVPKIQQSISHPQLQKLLEGFCSQLLAAKPQDISNTLWACAKLRSYPKEFFKAWGWRRHVGKMNLQDVSNIAYALAVFAHRDAQFMEALLGRAADLLEGGMGVGDVMLQNCVNLAWSVAVLDMQELASQLQPLVLACSAAPGRLIMEEKQSLFQVHIWMCDAALCGGQGLAGSGWVTQQQLQQWERSWREQLGKAQTSDFQADVHRELQGLALKLPGLEVKGMEVLEHVDGLFSIDVVAEFKGHFIAIEANGPHHFLSPDMRLTGDTWFRNRCLEARGYKVLSVPVNVWAKLKGSKDKQNWLQQQLDGLL